MNIVSIYIVFIRLSQKMQINVLFRIVHFGLIKIHTILSLTICFCLRRHYAYIEKISSFMRQRSVVYLKNIDFWIRSRTALALAIEIEEANKVDNWL